MTSHALAGRTTARRVAGQVRAELARKNKTAAELAVVLGCTPQTVGRRLNGRVDFTVTEIMRIAEWLDLNASELLKDAA